MFFCYHKVQICRYFFAWKIRCHRRQAKSTDRAVCLLPIYRIFPFKSLFRKEIELPIASKVFFCEPFFSKLITNFSPHKNISLTEYLSFFAWAQSVNCLAIVGSKYGSISSDNYPTSINCSKV